MVWCSVIKCKNNSKRKICDENTHIKFHTFPKNREIAQKWIKATGKKCINLKYARICSVHFTENDYLLKNKLMSTDIKKRKLRQDAVPSKFLQDNNSDCERTKRAEKRNRKILVQQLLLEK